MILSFIYSFVCFTIVTIVYSFLKKITLGCYRDEQAMSHYESPSTYCSGSSAAASFYAPALASPASTPAPALPAVLAQPWKRWLTISQGFASIPDLGKGPKIKKRDY